MTAEIYCNRLYKIYDDTELLSDLNSRDVLYCYELPIPFTLMSSTDNLASDDDTMIAVPCQWVAVDGDSSQNQSSSWINTPIVLPFSQDDVADPNRIYNLVWQNVVRWISKQVISGTETEAATKTRHDSSMNELAAPEPSGSAMDSLEGSDVNETASGQADATERTVSQSLLEQDPRQLFELKMSPAHTFSKHGNFPDNLFSLSFEMLKDADKISADQINSVDVQYVERDDGASVWASSRYRHV